MIYQISCDGFAAQIEILPEAMPVIIELVKFFVGWEDRIDDVGGDFAVLWCEDIAPELERAARETCDLSALVQKLRKLEACWPDADCSRGIRLVSVEYTEPEFFVTKIEETRKGGAL